MAATFRSSASTKADGVTSVTVSAPSGLAQGDLMLAWLSYNSGGTVSAPSGWNAVGSWMTASFASAQLFSHTAGNAEPSSYTFSLTGEATDIAAAILAYLVSGGAASVDAETQSNASAQASTYAAPAVTTSQPSETVVAFWAANQFNALSVPGGLAQRMSQPGDAQTIIAGDYAGPGTPGSSAPGSASGNTSPAPGFWFAATVAISVGAPAVPTLTSPANGSYIDLASAGGPFQWNYNSGGATGGETGYHFRIKAAGGSYQYWNASSNSLQSSDVANTSTATTLTLPASLLVDGTTYNWSVASVDAGGTSPFAADFTVTGQGSPSVTISAPTGTVSSTQMPTVTWSVSGATQGTYRVVTYSQTQYTATGFSPGAGTSSDDSGTVNSAIKSYTVATSLATGTTYRSYVLITSTPGGQASAWAFTTYTVSLNSPATPSLAVATGSDPTTGCPRVAITVQGFDNLLSANQAALMSGNTTGWTAGAGTTLSAVTSPAPPSAEGPYALQLAGSGTISALTGTGTGAIPVSSGQALTAFASFRSASTARSCTVAITWYTAAGATISTATGTAVNDSSSTWTQATVNATAPANASYGTVIPSVAAAAENHYVAEIELAPAGAASWTRGGLLGSTNVIVLRSDGQYVRGASPTNPFPMPTTAATGNFFILNTSTLNSSAVLGFTAVISTQMLTLYDYEATPYTSYTYTAFILASVGGNQIQSSGATSGSLQLATVLAWEFDPTNVATAIAAQFDDWTAMRNEQSAAHLVSGQQYPTVIAGAMGAIDLALEFFVSTPVIWQGLENLLISQKTLFISSPMGSSYYLRAGPQSGGLSSGMGNKVYSSALQPGSTATAPVRKVAVTFVAQPRPAP